MARWAAFCPAATALRAAPRSVSGMTEAGAIAALDALTQRLGPRWTAELEQTRVRCRATIAQLASKARHDARGNETPIFAHPRFCGGFHVRWAEPADRDAAARMVSRARSWFVKGLVGPHRKTLRA